MSNIFTFIDLFAGIGGFKCGLTKLGGKCVYSNEWDKYASLTYKAWYKSEISTDDIRSVDKTIIPNHDILCAGFPCQPFSIAGVSKKQSMKKKHGFEDEEQGNLFFSIMDIVDAKRPKVLFLENVKNLKSHDKGNTFKRIQYEIKKRNYELFSEVINSRYKVPQNRERLFLVAFDKEIYKNVSTFSFPSYKGEPKILKSILQDSVDKKYTLSDKLWSYLISYKAKHQKLGNGFGYGLVGPEDTSRTLSARYNKDGAEILIKQVKDNPRRLTPNEAARLMGFSYHYAKLFGHKNGFPQVVSDTQAYRQFGNSVVPYLIEDIAKNILKIM